MTQITFVHTSDRHVETFDRLLADKPDAPAARHIVREDWLQEAMRNGVHEILRASVLECLSEAAETSDVVVCTCSTIGTVADDCAEDHANLIRIDRPMAERAVAAGDKVLMVYCLDSTERPTRDLLADVAEKSGRTIAIEALSCPSAWQAFVRGDVEDFGRQIADTIRTALAKGSGDVSSILLAQASMAIAQDYLQDIDIPVLSSPAPALDAAMEVIR